ncbi:MAG: hypothetical protein QME05_00850 [Candidatus Margulisbacteria bacterium]|nr:hypothetical protein [Candidatus Margulisiibacteriota bacterium]
MTEEDVVIDIISFLDKYSIPYALTGGFAVSFYGKPRSTHDLDIIVQLIAGNRNIKELMTAFIKDYYVSEEGITDAIIHDTMFNIIHQETGFKIDFWILKNEEYAQESFSRRKRFEILGLTPWILSPEDMIINKLQWYKAAESDKHLKDARGIIEIQKDNIDQKYLHKWTNKLGLNSELKQVV